MPRGRRGDLAKVRKGWFADAVDYRLRFGMSNIPELLKTIYLGDRACKSIKIDCWNATVAMEIDCISRVRGTRWDYYNAENLEGGFLVFEEVDAIAFQPPGLIPNDFFGNFWAEPTSVAGRWKVTFEVGLVEITIGAASMHLQDAAGAQVP